MHESHQHGSAPFPGSDPFSEASYELRYRSSSALWSGNPNVQLMAETAALSPGAALDAGCGEGADAIWLAGLGWQVTAVDFSRTALHRAAELAAGKGSGVVARIDWRHLDITSWAPPENAYQLVTAQFLQLPSAQRGPVFRSLANAVAPEGTLLIVGHDPSDLQQPVRRPPLPDVFFTAEELASTVLEADKWDIVVCGSRPRTVQVEAGGTASVHDTVLRARKLP